MFFQEGEVSGAGKDKPSADQEELILRAGVWEEEKLRNFALLAGALSEERAAGAGHLGISEDDVRLLSLWARSDHGRLV